MPSTPLDNLVKIGKLKLEPPVQAELDGLIRSGSVRLVDAANEKLCFGSRFDFRTSLGPDDHALTTM
jgi:hypothetical protein